MRTIKAKKLDISSVMVDTKYVLPIIKTKDIENKVPIYLVLKEEFENSEEEDEIHLAFAKILSDQIRVENAQMLYTLPGLIEKKNNLTVIE